MLASPANRHIHVMDTTHQCRILRRVKPGEAAPTLTEVFSTLLALISFYKGMGLHVSVFYGHLPSQVEARPASMPATNEAPLARAPFRHLLLYYSRDTGLLHYWPEARRFSFLVPLAMIDRVKPKMESNQSLPRVEALLAIQSQRSIGI